MTATVTDPLQATVDCLEQVRESIPTLGGDEVLECLRRVESASRVTYSVMLDLIAETDTRNLAGEAGFGTTRRLLAGMLALSKAESRTRVSHAEAIGPRRALTGEQLPARLPETAAALAVGQIGAGQLRVIAETMTAVPDSTSDAERGWAEAHLAEWAPRLDPTALAKLGAHLLAHLDPDGPEPDDDNPAPAAGALRLRDRRDDGLGLEGHLTAEYGVALRELIDQLAKPLPAADHIPDPRGVEERQADALIEMVGLARSAEAAPTSGGEPPHLTVTLDLNMLIDGIGAAALDHGTFLSGADARRWACDAKTIPVVLGGKSEPLNVGRAMRTVPTGVRRALIVRDKGCAFPGCRRPPRRCSAHHVKHWIDGGETSVENCCLLCETHHRHVHNTGWEILIHPGYVEFIPPAILDPQRRPLRNPLRC